MAGVVLETLSWKKLIILGFLLLILLISFFLIGGLIGMYTFFHKLPVHLITPSSTRTQCPDALYYDSLVNCFLPNCEDCIKDKITMNFI